MNPIIWCITWELTIAHLTAGTQMVFFFLNLVEGLGILLMCKPFLGEKKKTNSHELHWYYLDHFPVRMHGSTFLMI